MSICNAIARTATEHADGHPVSQVTVRIGYLRQVVPDALQFNWEVVSAQLGLEDAELVIEHVPAVVECRACGAVDVRLVSGEELLVVSIDLVGA